jgi:hypothetical protein
VRVALRPSQASNHVRRVDLSVPVPRTVRSGFLVVGGGSRLALPRATSYAGLLSALRRTPAATDVAAQLWTRSGATVPHAAPAGDIVLGGSFIRVLVVHA